MVGRPVFVQNYCEIYTRKYWIDALQNILDKMQDSFSPSVDIMQAILLFGLCFIFYFHMDGKLLRF